MTAETCRFVGTERFECVTHGSYWSSDDPRCDEVLDAIARAAHEREDDE